MIRSRKLTSWAGIAALLLAPLPAAAQRIVLPPASGDELSCISDGIVQSAGRGDLDSAGASALVQQCRQRFGWSDMETQLAVLIGQVTIRMFLALADTDSAGVARSVVSDVMGTFGSEVIRDLQLQNLDPDTGYPDIARQATARFAERGVTGQTAAKATRAVIYGLIAIRLSAHFRTARSSRGGN